MAQLIKLIDNTENTFFYAIYFSAPTQELLHDAAKIENKLPFACQLPCGNIYNINDISELPKVGEDLPCPCGHPNHFFVKWKVGDNEQ